MENLKKLFKNYINVKFFFKLKKNIYKNYIILLQNKKKVKKFGSLNN